MVRCWGAVRVRGLFRHADFMKLWTGQTISMLGTELGALYFLAIVVLQASPLQMGILGTLGTLPVLLVGLQAGVWADRVRRRPLMIAADAGRALLLISIPVVAALGRLRIEHLFLVALLAGTLTVVFDIGYRSILPSLVRRDQLLDANGKLEASASIAEMSGSAIGGGLVQLFSAQVAVVCDACSFLVSALFVSAIRRPEPEPAPATERQDMRREIAEGLRVILHNPILRATTANAVMASMFGNIIGATYGLFVLRELNLSPFVFGLVVASGALGGLAGAMLSERTARLFGVGPAIIGAMLIRAASQFLTPLAHGPAGVAVAFLVAGQLGDVGWTIFNINEVSLRQAIVPDRLLGRANATIHFLSQGARPIGMLGGGVLAELLGLRPALYVASTGLLLSCLWLVFSPVRTLRVLPEPVDIPAN
jgi:MFS family permease